MNLTGSTLAMGVTFAIVAGIMCGAFALPMRYLGRWSWENVWTIYTLVSCIVFPIIIVSATVPSFLHVLEGAPAAASEWACGCGLAWGFGSILFGQGVSAVGISMANTLVLAISASLGSLLPIGLLAPERLHQPQGYAILLGVIVGIVGVACCGYAGLRREKSQGGHQETVRGGMVGSARSFGAGLLLCVGAGSLSAVLNIGYTSAQALRINAIRLGYGSFAGSNVIWLLMLTSGAIPNLCFCGYLLSKNETWRKFAMPDGASLYLLSALMGLVWGGDIFLYGLASPMIGRLGPAIGWPLKLISGLITANLAGYLIGEWKLTRAGDRRWMAFGIFVSVAAIIILGWASTLE